MRIFDGMDRRLIRTLLEGQAAGYTAERSARLHSYTLDRDIPLNLVVYNANREPVIVAVDAPAGVLLEAIVRDYSEILWIYDGKRARSPLYDCRRRVWTNPPSSGIKREPRRKLRTGLLFLALSATGLLLLLWTLLSR